MKITYKILLLVISLLLVITITIGTSYSLWKKVEVQKEQNIVESACFSIEFSESSNINLKNAMPISDASGLKKTPYTFTIKNTCNADSKTKISLNVLNSSTMDSSIIKFSMKYGSLANSTPVLLNTFNKGDSSTNVKESYLVKEDIIRGNEEKTYSIYLWMDESAGKEYMNKIFNAKVSVTSEAIEDAPKYMAETITDLASKDTINFADDDPDNNIRYIGVNPNNYVYFNCSDYSNQSDSTCEKWRIIGLFKNMPKENGTQEDLIKIIRNESIGTYPWNTAAKNDWTNSSLQNYLNSGEYYLNNLQNDITKESISSVSWNTGGSASTEDATTSTMYIRERSKDNYSTAQTHWTGKVGLMYPSDYGYAVDKSVRSVCISEKMYYLDNNKACHENNYLYKTYIQWTLTHRSADNYGVFNIRSVGSVSGYSSANSYNVHPSLYLKYNISITSGDGSSTRPYQLSLK